ncbi:MAG TPA: glycosyltransferase family 39 protein, partial [Candidatus Goldiibacteriota bacterium]|nr:glycosyltransferase family 39 protein [Candidatus Goldiibacteriota bacterium]
MKNKKQLFFMLLLAVAVFLRFFRLGSAALSPAEIDNCAISLEPGFLQVFFGAMDRGAHPPLFNVIQGFFMALAGTGNFSARFLPALFGALGFLVFFRTARSLFSEKVAYLAAVLYAINPLFIQASRQAGPESMFLLLSMLVLYYFFMSLKYNSFIAGPYTIWSIAALYTHSSAVFLILALNFIVLVTHRKDLRPGPWLLSQAVVFSAWLPYAVASIKPAEPQLTAVSVLLAPLYQVKSFFFGMHIAPSLIIIAAVVVCVFFTVLGAASRHKAAEKRLLDAMAITAGLGIFFQFVIALKVPQESSAVNLGYAAALTLLILSVGASYMSDIGLFAFSALVISVTAYALVSYYRDSSIRPVDYRSIYVKAVDLGEEGDLVVHTSPVSYRAFSYYNDYAIKAGFSNKLRQEPKEEELPAKGAVAAKMRKNMREWLRKS